MNKPKVSVIIPTYNRESEIKRAIESVLSQTIKDFEIIIIDDGSTDSTEKICMNYTKYDNRIKYFKHSPNKGANYARNQGIKKSNGDYIAFLDSDDEWIYNKLEKQIKAFEKASKNVGFILTGIKQIDLDSGKEWFWPNKTFRRQNNILDGLIFHIGLSRTSTVLIKREAIEKVKGFDEIFPKFQEGEFFLRLLKYYKNIFIKEPLTIGFISNSSEHVSYGIKKGIKAQLLLLNKHQKLFKKFPAIYSFRLFEIGLSFLFQLNSTKKFLIFTYFALRETPLFTCRLAFLFLFFSLNALVEKLLKGKKFNIEEFRLNIIDILIKKYSNEIL